MSMHDNINKLDEITIRLDNAKTILGCVCDNYFAHNKEGTDSTILYYQYETFSNLIRIAFDMVYDSEKEYRELSDVLLKESNAIKCIKNKMEEIA